MYYRKKFTLTGVVMASALVGTAIGTAAVGLMSASQKRKAARIIRKLERTAMHMMKWH